MRSLLATMALVTASVGAVGAAAPATAVPPAPDGQCSQSGLTVTCVFGYTGAAQYWTVPPMVTSVTFAVTGAAGGDGAFGISASGGRGGGATTTMTVTPLAKLQVNVGGKGQTWTSDSSPGKGGWNGGGDSGANGGGGGGGASDVRYSPYGTANRMIVGGGGGGGGTITPFMHANAVAGPGGAGGGGGNLAGPPSPGTGVGGMNSTGPTTGGGGGAGFYVPAGRAGGGASGGIASNCYNWLASAKPGVGGSGSQGGVGGVLVNTPGNVCPGGFGGGGGGGYTGGGGGGGGVYAGAGGGGGSGYAPPGSINFLGAPGAGGEVRITYNPPAGWTQIGGHPMGSSPAVTKRPGTGIEDVFYLDTDREGWHRVITNGVPTADEYIGGVFYPGSSLAAISSGPNRIDVFGRGQENWLWHKFWNGTTWSAWKPIPNTSVASSPTVASMAPGRLDVFAKGPHNELVQVTSTDSGANWSGQDHLTAPDRMTDDPAAISIAQGTINVFYRSARAGLPGLAVTTYDRGWRESIHWTEVSPSSSPAVASNGLGTISLIWREGGNLVSGTYNRKSLFGGRVDRGPSYSPTGSKVALSPVGDSVYKAYVRGTDNVLYAYSYW